MKYLLMVVTFICVSSFSFANSVVVEGLGSQFVINKGTGFTSTVNVVANGVTVTEGQAREDAFVAAAKVWADILVSPVPVAIDASFSALDCNASQAVLGSAGAPNFYYRTSGSAVILNTWYPPALISSLLGTDVDPSLPDIEANFNSDIGDADCLSGSGWYYGTDGNVPTGYTDFYEVVLHEIGHGLGILSLTLSDGRLQSIPDLFALNLKDHSTGKLWMDMTDAERNTSMRNDGNLVWDGSEVTLLEGQLTSGSVGGRVQMYAPSTYKPGSSVSHFDTRLTPNELMEFQWNAGGLTYDHSVALLKDIGWTIYESGTAVPVIANQSALSTNEDTNLTINLSDLTVTDSDSTYPDDFSLTVFAGSNYSVSGNTVIPDPNYNGSLTVPVRVNDGTNNSNQFSLVVSVISVNDAPTITDQSPLSVNEDNSITLTIGNLTIVDPDDSSFTIAVSAGSNYSFSGSTVTPNANYNGTLSVPITVNDGEDDSATFDLAITVNAVNDKPVISATPTLTIEEDASYEFTLSDFTVSDVETNSSDLTLQIMSGTDYTVSGNTVTPTAEFSGSLSINARVFDGTAYSDTAIFTLTVTNVNDTPDLNGTPVTSIVEGEFYSAQFSTTDPDGPSLNYSLSSAHSWLSINNSGLLSGTATGPLGTESVTVTVTDGNTTDSFTFNLNVIGSSFADVSVTIDANNHLIAVGNSADITMTISNVGPAANATGTASISHTAGATLTNLDSRCVSASSTTITCTYSAVSSPEDFTFSLRYDAPTTTTLRASLSPTQTDINLDDNIADTTVFFSGNTVEPSQRLDFSATANTQAAAVGNLDDTGTVELVLANDLSTDEEQVSFNSGFTAVSIASDIFAINVDAYDVLIDDFNNDGEPDVVFANASSNSVYLADVTGGFSNPSVISSLSSLAVASSDLNNDGFNDLIFANSGANDVFLNDQSGGFIFAESLGDSTSTDVAALDSNGDGWPDLIFTNSDDDDLIYLNNGDGTFNAAAIPVGALLTNSQSVLVAALDDDGAENDIIIGRYTLENTVSLEVYQVVSNVLTSTLELDGGDVISISTGDYDGDGQVDIAAVNTDGVVQVYSQDVGAFSLSKTFVASDASQVLLTEIDADNKADLIVLRGAFKASHVFLSDIPEEETAPIVIEVIIVEPVTNTDSGNSDSGLRVTQSGGLSGWMLIISLLLLFSRRRQPV